MEHRLMNGFLEPDLIYQPDGINFKDRDRDFVFVDPSSFCVHPRPTGLVRQKTGLRINAAVISAGLRASWWREESPPGRGWSWFASADWSPPRCWLMHSKAREQGLAAPCLQRPAVCSIAFAIP